MYVCMYVCMYVLFWFLLINWLRMFLFLFLFFSISFLLCGFILMWMKEHKWLNPGTCLRYHAFRWIFLMRLKPRYVLLPMTLMLPRLYFYFYSHKSIIFLIITYVFFKIWGGFDQNVILWTHQFCYFCSCFLRFWWWLTLLVVCLLFFLQIPNGAAGHYLLGLIYRLLFF